MSRKPRHYLLFALLIVLAVNVQAQPPESEESSKYSFNYTKVVPGMPENASLGAYGNVPVNLAKGVPTVEFTLYTLSKGGVNIPISISYAASGIKYNEVPSAVGMSWQLNAGGSINRSVNGLVDEDFLLYNLAVIDSARIARQNDHINSHNTQDSAIMVASNDYDFSLDYYYYSFPGHSGSMYLNKYGSFVPDKEFSKILINAADHLDSFSIKDGAGNTYYFGTYTDQSTVYSLGKYNKQARSSFYARVAWKLKKIVTATKQEILFEYLPYIYEYMTRDSERYDVYQNNSGSVTVGSCTYGVGFNGASFQTTRFVNTANLLSRIITDDQEVLFEYAQDTTLALFEKQLKAVKVYSKISGDTVKTILLSHNGSFLESFTEKDKSSATPGKTHSFQYNGGYAIDPYSMARDIFGYYNGETGNNSLIDNPSLHTMYYPAGVASRVVNEYYATLGVLNQISYPTGGKTHFSYEYNKTGSGGINTLYAPGLRVKSVWDTDETDKIYNRKNFYYRNLSGGISYADMTIVTENSAVVDPAMVNVFHSDPLNPDGFDNFYYQTVLIENTGSGTGSERLYEKYYYGTQYELYGKMSPLLLRKEVFDTDTFHLQQSEVYEYETYTVDSAVSFMFTLRKPVPYVGYFYYEDDPSPRYCCPPFSIYQGYDFKHIMKPRIYNLKKQRTTNFSTLGDSLVNVTEHFYLSDPVALRRTETTGSEGITTKVVYKYPVDYPANGTLAAMSSSFIILPVVKEEYYINSVLKREKENNYASAGSGVYVLDNQVIRDVPASKTQTLHYYGYNRKINLLSRGREDDVTTSYIWNYLDELPVAEVANADTLSIAYTSFEADGKGRWSFSGAAVADATAVTGKNTYGLSSGTITRSALSSGTVYIVSYWSKGSAVSITGTQSGWPHTLATITVGGQAWTLYEHKITGQTSISLSGAVTIDELRLYPEKAQMTSYAYEPLIGITSQSDANGRVVYYDYDGLDRLKLVRDQDGNVLRKVCYNYLGQPENCPGALYWNRGKSMVFTKNNCGLGYTGTWVVYSIPAGIYSSNISQLDADEQAGNFYTDGQTYANAHGDCVPVYYNVLKSGSFTRDNCDPGYISSPVTYAVQPNIYSSLVSQAQADALAQADVDANGQAYANANGTCIMYCPDCEDEGKKCVNFICETGIKIYSGSSWDPIRHRYICNYHYEFSDGSWSMTYFEFSNTECFSE
ncbi:MAG: DUF5977 domain-containing protein [Chitinophagaceae bacterium]